MLPSKTQPFFRPNDGGHKHSRDIAPLLELWTLLGLSSTKNATVFSVFVQIYIVKLNFSTIFSRNCLLGWPKRPQRKNFFLQIKILICLEEGLEKLFLLEFSVRFIKKITLVVEILKWYIEIGSACK